MNNTNTKMATGEYLGKITELSSILSRDRDDNKITYEQWNEVFESINAVWVKLCDIDGVD